MSRLARGEVEKFRARMHEMVDIVADYYLQIESRKPRSSVRPGDLRRSLGSSPPQTPMEWPGVKTQLEELIFSGANHWQHPMNFGYFPAQTSFPAIMGEMVSKALNNPGFSWHVSPINTELEILMNDWVADMLGIPDFYKHMNRQGGGLTHTTASESLLVAMIGALNKKVGPNPVVYVSDQGHFSTQKASRILRVDCRIIPTEWNSNIENYSMSLDTLRQEIDKDKQAGRTPAMVVATFGTTGTCGIDPIREIGEIARQEGMWFHMDAAYAGSALICPEFRPLADGLDTTDSFNFNGHKWLLTGFGNSSLYIKDPEMLTKTLSAQANYVQPAKPEETDFMTWQIPQGRDFRGIRWWMLLNQYGVEGLQAHIRGQVGLAKYFDSLLKEDPDFQVPFRTIFGLVCFKATEGDSLTRKLAERLQGNEEAIFTSSEVDGMKIIRLAITSEYTEKHHLDRAYQIVKESLAQLRSNTD